MQSFYTWCFSCFAWKSKRFVFQRGDRFSSWKYKLSDYRHLLLQVDCSNKSKFHHYLWDDKQCILFIQVHNNSTGTFGITDAILDIVALACSVAINIASVRI